MLLFFVQFHVFTVFLMICWERHYSSVKWDTPKRRPGLHRDKTRKGNFNHNNEYFRMLKKKRKKLSSFLFMQISLFKGWWWWLWFSKCRSMSTYIRSIYFAPPSQQDCLKSHHNKNKYSTHLSKWTLSENHIGLKARKSTALLRLFHEVSILLFSRT